MRGEVEKGEWADLAVPGALLDVRVTPGARHEAARREDARIFLAVTAPPEDGKATAAVRTALARALGIAPSRLALVAGATSRDKRFRVEG